MILFISPKFGFVFFFLIHEVTSLSAAKYISAILCWTVPFDPW